MASPTKRQALNLRALRAAAWLEVRCDELADQMKIQNIEPPLFGKTITLKATDVEKLIKDMKLHLHDLRRYAEHPRKSQRRNPFGHTP